MDLQWLFLILIAVGIVFGIGVLIASRRSATRDAPPTEPGPRTTRPPDRTGPPDSAGPDTGAADTATGTAVLEPGTVEPEVVEPGRSSPRSSSRLRCGRGWPRRVPRSPVSSPGFGGGPASTP
ncbi:MAG: hypothetical protein WD225_05270, partial [Ilumatobacteraceae bacterium]